MIQAFCVRLTSSKQPSCRADPTGLVEKVLSDLLYCNLQPLEQTCWARTSGVVANGWMASMLSAMHCLYSSENTNSGCMRANTFCMTSVKKLSKISPTSSTVPLPKWRHNDKKQCVIIHATTSRFFNTSFCSLSKKTKGSKQKIVSMYPSNLPPAPTTRPSHFLYLSVTTRNISIATITCSNPSNPRITSRRHQRSLNTWGHRCRWTSSWALCTRWLSTEWRILQYKKMYYYKNLHKFLVSYFITI